MTDIADAQKPPPLRSDDADVSTTLYNVGDAKISRSVKGGLCLLEVSGIYSSSVGKELEKISVQWEGDLGLAFGEIKTNNRSQRKFAPSVVGGLRNIRNKLKTRNKTLTLCSPPNELVDVLRLSGTLDYFHVMDSSGVLQVNPQKITKRPPPQTAATTQQKKIQHLSQSLSRTKKLEKGLDSAAEYIARFLPQQPPKLAGYEFSFLYQTSEKVGGDFFDFIPLGSGRLGVCIGDVSGHGMDAAILMGISKKVMHIRAMDDVTNSPKAILCKASKDISEDFKRSSFVTSLYGVLDANTGEFTFARAGHEHPIILGPAPGQHNIVESQGSPLGLDRVCDLSVALEERTIEIAEGSFLVLTTDGLPEARNEKKTQYTRERLFFDLAKVSKDMSCKQVLRIIRDSLQSFTNGASQEDDITVILIKRDCEH